VNHRSLVIVGALAAVLAGCGGSSKTDPAGPASALAMCEALIPAVQAKVTACVASGLPDAILPAYLGLALNCQTFAEAQAAGRVAFDQAKAKACIDTFNAASCGTALSGGLLNAACLEAVAPRVAAGGTCFSGLDFECVAGFCDQTVTNACSVGGRCVTSATLGQSCAAPAQCANGLICDTGSTTCVARPPITIAPSGGSCAGSYTACADGNFCDGTSTCAPMRAAGASCASGAACQPGLACDSVSTTCVVRLRLGEACVQGQGRCAGSTYCGAGSTCVASPRVGDDCRAISGEMVFCQESWCQPPVAPSTARTCAPYAAPGAACVTSNVIQCGLAYQCAAVSGTAGVCGRNYCGGA
jgi:hypothetical protein